ncbi:MAG: serine/threonine protein kinase [Phycisphaerales bacterium]|nr:MAG: serine/threonine protein kinase [Phycisphaerales bacterium]
MRNVGMDNARRSEAEQLFQRVADVPRQERTLLLNEHCRTDPSLRRDVELLLDRYDNPTVPVLRAVDLADEVGLTDAREHIGPYKLMELIGEGGFASVYMAQQQEPVRRRVALKIIKLGMDTRQVVARFEAERQALAMMEHSNIAKVFDGGATETGRPYFVMELVRGVPITEYCDENRLTTRERLELFSQVCRAVQHAHLKGVIHRDIKPSNVLVTFHDGVPIPKIIDFGIAKAMDEPLTDKTLFTGFRQFVGTPEYVSPEQTEISGGDIDTRSDIYSLGVLLYELLTGTTPFSSKTFRNATYAEMLRTIREEPPITPSRRLSTLSADVQAVASARRTELRTLSKLVRGDLDWIVIKALEKDRARRYETAAALAADIKHHLAAEPLLAGPPSASYRFRKTVARHKAVFGFVTALFLLITCFGILMGFLYADADRLRLQAESQRSVAELNLQRARDAEERAEAEAGFMHELLASVDPNRAQRREISVRYLLDEAARRIEEGWLEEHPDVQSALRLTLGNTYYSLGLYTVAEAHLRAAEEAYTGAFGDEHADTLRARCALGRLFNSQGKPVEASALLSATARAQGRVLGEHHPDTLQSLDALARTTWYPGKYERWESILRETLQAQRRVLGDEDIGTLTLMISYGGVLNGMKRHAEAETLLREALENARRLFGEEHTETARAAYHLGFALEKQGKYEEAETLFLSSLDTDRRFLGVAHPTTHSRLLGLLRVLRFQGKLQEIRSFVIDEIALLKSAAHEPKAGPLVVNSYAWFLLTCEPADLRDAKAALAAARRAVELSRSENASILDTLALAYQMTGDIDQAIATQELAVTRASLTGEFSGPYMPRKLAEYFCEKGDFLGAARVYRDFVAQRLSAEEITDVEFAESLLLWAREYIDRGQHGAAELLLRTCLAVQEDALPEAHLLAAKAKSSLGKAMMSQQRLDSAESLLLDAYALMAVDPEADEREVRLTLEGITDLYETWGKPLEASEWRAKLIENEAR